MNDKVMTTISSKALAILGCDSISNMTEKTKEAAACSLFFDSTLRLLLRMHPWNFATKRISLALNREEDGFYYYEKPSDCVFIQSIQPPGSAGKLNHYWVEGSEIKCEFKPAIVAYTSEDAALKNMDPIFESVLIYRLAEEICVNLTGDMNKKNQLFQKFSLELENARLQDAREGYQPALESNPYYEARD